MRNSLGPSLGLLLSLCAAACSDDSNTGNTPDGNESMGGANQGSMGGGANASSEMTGGEITGGNGGSSQTGGGTTPQGGSSGTAGSAATGSGEPVSLPGVCGARGNGVVTVEDYQVKEERYLLGDRGFGPDICVVSFDVKRVGDAPPGCDQAAAIGGQATECQWTHRVRYENPTVVLDENGVCANSDLGMDEEAIAAIDGREVSFGYVFEYQGHNSVTMIYDDEQQAWTAGGNAGWDAMTGDFLFDERQGSCRYTPAP